MNDVMWKPPIMADLNGKDFADRPHREMRIGAAIIALFFLGFLGWAAVTPLDAGAYAQGIVAVSGNRRGRPAPRGRHRHRARGRRGADGYQRTSAAEDFRIELVATERGLTGEGHRASGTARAAHRGTARASGSGRTRGVRITGTRGPRACGGSAARAATPVRCAKELAPDAARRPRSENAPALGADQRLYLSDAIQQGAAAFDR